MLLKLSSLFKKIRLITTKLTKIKHFQLLFMEFIYE